MPSVAPSSALRHAVRAFAACAAVASGPLGCNLIFGQSDLEVGGGSGGAAPPSTTSGATVTGSSSESVGPGGAGQGGDGGAIASTAGSGGASSGGGADGCGGGAQDNDDDGVCADACTERTCSGQGTCDDTSGEALCTCATGFAGPRCDVCDRGHEGDGCATCSTGFQDTDGDGACLAACDDATCSGQGTCDDASGTATCLCRPGFEGAGCEVPCPAGMAGAACDFRVVLGLDVPVDSPGWTTAASVPYDVDATAGAAPFDRVAYRLRLDDAEVWVEMAPFTDDATLLGVPVDWVWDVPVVDATVLSFAANQPQVTAPTAGNVEMWSDCYDPGLNGVYDHDDDRGDSPDCFGSMQVHVANATVLAFNRFGPATELVGVGIGNSPGPHPDWTFASNAGDFTTRRLEVYIRE